LSCYQQHHIGRAYNPNSIDENCYNLFLSLIYKFNETDANNRLILSILLHEFDNFYINYYITSYPPECNIDNTYVDYNSLKIISYDGLTHLATLNGKFNDTYWPDIDPNNNSVFALRKELPCNQGILLNTTSQEFPNGIYGETYTSFYICSNVNYTGDFLRIPEFYDNLDVNPPYYNGIRKIILTAF
jgi:hypothetical protein